MDTDEIRDVLLRTSTSFHSLELECDAWYELDVLNVLNLRWAAADTDGQNGAIVAIGGEASPQVSGGPPPTSRLHADWHVWWRRPDCWRDDYAYDAGTKSVTIVCPERSANHLAPLESPERSSRAGTLGRLRATFGRAHGHHAWVPPDPPSEVRERLEQMPLVSPEGLAHGWDLAWRSEAVHAGRPVVQVHARRTECAGDFGLWPYIHEYELLVDREFGVLLRCMAVHADREAALIEVRRIAFDRPIADAVFENRAGEHPGPEDRQ